MVQQCNQTDFAVLVPKSEMLGNPSSGEVAVVKIVGALGTCL